MGLVYQVRSIDARGNVRVIKNYDLEDDAKSAIATMRQRSPARYEYISIPKPPTSA